MPSCTLIFYTWKYIFTCVRTLCTKQSTETSRLALAANPVTGSITQIAEDSRLQHPLHHEGWHIVCKIVEFLHFQQTSFIVWYIPGYILISMWIFAVMNLIEDVSVASQSNGYRQSLKQKHTTDVTSDIDTNTSYLLKDIDVFLTHEPCTMFVDWLTHKHHFHFGSSYIDVVKVLRRLFSACFLH